MSKETEAAAASPQPVFTKEQLMRSKSAGNPADALGAVLRDDRGYTLQEAEKLLKNYLERKV